MARLQSLERQQASMYQTVTMQGAILHRVESRPQTSVEGAAWASREIEVLQARVADLTSQLADVRIVVDIGIIIGIHVPTLPSVPRRLQMSRCPMPHFPDKGFECWLY